VLVALGKLPLDVLRAALTPPARMNLPLAPPGTLMLRNAQFMKFRSSWDGRPSITQKCSGETLSLLSRGIEKQENFAQDFLLPAINEQFVHHDWERWLETIGFAYYDVDVGSIVAKRSQEWAMQRESRKLKRQQAILEESDG
jgi:tRNA pseudouridine38-40 synthase